MEYDIHTGWPKSHATSWADPWENGHLNAKILEKNMTFKKKLPKFFIFFKKIANGNFFEKNENFWQFF